MSVTKFTRGKVIETHSKKNEIVMHWVVVHFVFMHTRLITCSYW